MKRGMKIACVIPSFNHARYVGEAIESVLRQSLSPEKLVIIDDGSKDNSVAVIRAIKDPRIHLIVQENQGAHVALNRGLEICMDCDFISLLNSDDRYHPTRFARCVAHFDQYPETQLVCSRIRLIDESGKPVGQRDSRQRRLNKIWSRLRPKTDTAVALSYGNFTKTTSNFFFRKGTITEFRPYRYVHDYFAALTVAFQTAIGFVHEDLLDYRVHSANTIKAEGKGAVVQEVIRMHLDLLTDLRPSLESDPLLRKRVLQYLKAAMNNYTDMRAELLILSIARAMSRDPEPTRDLMHFPETAERSAELP
jgi:glycosyltransferase involved in cell wall biosynthesis